MQFSQDKGKHDQYNHQFQNLRCWAYLYNILLKHKRSGGEEKIKKEVHGISIRGDWTNWGSQKHDTQLYANLLIIKESGIAFANKSKFTVVINY